MCRSHRGVSLIELLVVVMLFGVLIGMLVPVVQQVRETAKRVECGNRLRQLGIALHAYHAAWSIFPIDYDQPAVSPAHNTFPTFSHDGANPANFDTVHRPVTLRGARSTNRDLTTTSDSRCIPISRFWRMHLLRRPSKGTPFLLAAPGRRHWSGML